MTFCDEAEFSIYFHHSQEWKEGPINLSVITHRLGSTINILP